MRRQWQTQLYTHDIDVDALKVALNALWWSDEGDRQEEEEEEEKEK